MEIMSDKEIKQIQELVLKFKKSSPECKFNFEIKSGPFRFGCNSLLNYPGYCTPYTCPGMKSK